MPKNKIILLNKSINDNMLMLSIDWIGSSIKIQSTGFPDSGFLVFKALAKNILKLKILICAVLKYRAGIDFSLLPLITFIV